MIHHVRGFAEVKVNVIGIQTLCQSSQNVIKVMQELRLAVPSTTESMLAWVQQSLAFQKVGHQ